MSVDLQELRAELKKLHPRTQLFVVLREELSELGYWKNRPRGNPMPKGYDPRRAVMVKPGARDGS